MPPIIAIESYAIADEYGEPGEILYRDVKPLGIQEKIIVLEDCIIDTKRISNCEF